MTHLIKEYSILNNEIIDQLATEYEKIPYHKWQGSHVYMIKDSRKIIDYNKRISEFVEISDESLFDLCDRYIAEVNAIDQMYKFYLVRNNVTFIKYESGGFFEMHKDYLSYKTNIFEEFTMIICKDAECDGGETEFTINENTKQISDATKTPGHSVIFRKDILHQGVLLKSGYKKIITLNLIAIPKELPEDGICIIGYPNKRFILSYREILLLGETLLSLCIKDANDKQQKTFYHESIVPENLFIIIYKIYKKQPISYDEYIIAEDYIKAYAIPGNVIIAYPTINNIGDVKFASINETIDDYPVIICNSREEMIYNWKYQEKIGTDFISFHMIIAEGKISNYWNIYEGDEGYTIKTYDMDPVYLALGEEEALLFMETSLYYDQDQVSCPEEMVEVYSLHGDNKITINKKYDINEYIKIDNPAENKRVVFSEELQNEYSIYYKFPDGKSHWDLYECRHFDLKYKIDKKLLYLRFTGECRELQDLPKHEIVTVKCDVAEEFKMDLCKMIKTGSLKSTIKNVINKLDLIITHDNEEVNLTFCNESVYGTMTLISIYGLIARVAARRDQGSTLDPLCG